MNELKRIGFVYTVEHYTADKQLKSVETVHNIIPNVGLNYILGAAFSGDSQYTDWYIGLYEANYTPLATDTMTTLLASCTENTDYDGTTRLEAVFPAVSGGLLTTTASPTEFDFSGAATITGAFLTSNPTQENTGGLLVSAVLFSSPKVMAAGETLKVPVGLALASV